MASQQALQKSKFKLREFVQLPYSCCEVQDTKTTGSEMTRCPAGVGHEFGLDGFSCLSLIRLAATCYEQLAPLQSSQQLTAFMTGSLGIEVPGSGTS